LASTAPETDPLAASLRPPQLHVDLAAIAHNWRLLAARAAPGQCGACVKADAYGLGLGPVARALAAAGCTEFFVATAAEGTALRRHAPDATAYVLGGYRHADAPAYADRMLVPALNDLEQVAAWHADHGRAPAALQIDTGMARLGLAPEELATLIADARRTRLDIALLVSHLACADRAHDPRNAAQREAFEAARVALGAPRASLAASSALFLGDAYRYDLARPGAALYGVNPQPGRPNPMRAVVRLEAPVLQVRDVHAPTGVGYGATFQAATAGNRARVRIGRVEVPVVGRVSMDVVTVDIGALPAGAVHAGTPAVLLDDGYGVDALAGAADTIGYEILTRLGSACARRYHRGEAQEAE
jgi:alanine racemase